MARTSTGFLWELIKGTPRENINKIVLIVVNAETQLDTKWDRSESIPPVSAMLSAYPSIGIERYNEETMALLKESVNPWTDVIRAERYRGGAVSTAPGSCGDTQFLCGRGEIRRVEGRGGTNAF